MEGSSVGSDNKWAELLWDEFKYRHELYWKSLYLWGGGVIAVVIAPFIKPELRSLGIAIYILPVIAFAISLIGAWHLAAESERLKAVGKKYTQIRGETYSPDVFFEGQRTWYQQVVTEPLGKTVTILFTFGALLFTIVDALFLTILLWPSIWVIPFVAGILLMVTFGIGVVLVVESRKRRHNNHLMDKKTISMEKTGKEDK